jgi:hypothetical protein
MRKPFRSIAFACVTLAALLQAGCITSESSKYERQLSSIVTADFQPNRDVAVAFNLAADGQLHVPVTAVRDD